MAVPTLLYGSEAWTMKRADFQKIQMSEMKFLRAVGGYNLLDKKRSEEIRKELLVKVKVKVSHYTPWRRLGGKGGIAPTHT
jgi:hypothetical protein